MAETAITSLLEQLKEVLKWHKDLLSDSKDEFQKLNDDLKYMKAFLRDAGNRSEKAESLKVITRQIRDVLYEVEDTIDVCLMAAAKRKSSIHRRLMPNKMSFAKEVKSLREDKIKPLLDQVKAVIPAPYCSAATSSEQPPPMLYLVNNCLCTYSRFILLHSLLLDTLF